MLSTSSISTTLLPIPTPLERFVLLVDDHVPSLEQLQSVVETAGYRCVTTTSASDALVFCDLRSPDLVVTDLAMPHLDGAGLARWLKARYPAVPLLLLTGEALDSQTTKTLRQTFTAVLRKPLEVEMFLALLNDLLPRTSSASEAM